MHFDHIGTEVGQQHPGDGTGHAAGKVQHAHAGERRLFFRWRQRNLRYLRLLNTYLSRDRRASLVMTVTVVPRNDQRLEAPGREH
jgi:hypothetical protein